RRALGRTAREDALAARGGGKALRVERSLNLEGVDAVHPVLTATGRELLQLIVGFGEGPPPERDADLVRPGGGEEADVLQPLVRLVQGAVEHLVVQLHVL